VTELEYESRAERYDKQLTDAGKIDIAGKSAAEKVALLRAFREQQYETLKDAVYKRRGWTPEGIPTLATVKRLGIDFPEVVALLKANGVTA
jgi:aldehyde:ferredoxin oxidoreductase